MIHVTNGILEGNMMQKAAIDLLIVGNFIFFLQSAAYDSKKASVMLHWIACIAFHICVKTLILHFNYKTSIQASGAPYLMNKILCILNYSLVDFIGSVHKLSSGSKLTFPGSLTATKCLPGFKIPGHPEWLGQDDVASVHAS